jgi:ribosomal protein S18 acetylase RimI-like enzyme
MDTSSAHRIRPARSDDLEAIVALEAQAFDPARRTSRASLRRALRSPFQRVLVLEAAGGEGSGRVAGYVVVWPFRRTWRIYNLASDPARRNQGVGGALLAAAAAEARRAGAARLVLEARLEPGLVRFYEQRGFRTCRTLPNYYAEGEDAIRMEQALPPVP